MTPHPVGAVRPRMPDIRQAARASVPIVHDVADAADRPAPTNPVEAISPAPTAGPRTWAGFAILCVGMFIAILDIQIVATSLPRIQAGLGIAPDRISWVQTAYLTAELLVIPLTGPLTRLSSLRRLFVTSVTLFTLASCGCAASGGFASLIVWRALQGASGGALIPTVFSAVFLLFPPNRQGIATAVAGTLAVLAPTAGPVVGGWITETAYLALAVPDQRAPRHRLGHRRVLAAVVAGPAARTAQRTRCAGPGAPGRRPGQSGARPQGGPGIRLDGACNRRTSRREHGGRRSCSSAAP